MKGRDWKFLRARRVVASSMGAAIVLGLTACVTPPKPMYQWAGYQEAVFEYLKTDGANPGPQITLLEAQVQKNAATGDASPPGLHAHLALLYSKAGDDAKAVEYLQAERKLFPESGPYINFLLTNATKTAAKPAATNASPNPSAPRP